MQIPKGRALDKMLGELRMVPKENRSPKMSGGQRRMRKLTGVLRWVEKLMPGMTKRQNPADYLTKFVDEKKYRASDEWATGAGKGGTRVVRPSVKRKWGDYPD